MAAKKRRTGRVIGITALALLVVIVAGGGVGVYLYTDRAKPGILVAGQEAAGKDAVELTQIVDAVVDSFELTFVDVQNRTVTARPSQFGLSFDQGATINAAITGNGEQNPLALYNPWQAKNISLVHTIDEATALSFFNERITTAESRPVDASVGYDEKAKKFVVTSGVVGLGVDMDSVRSAVANIVAGENQVSPVKTIETQPLISDAAASEAAARANAALALKLEFTSSQGKYQIPVATIAKWTSFKANADGALEVIYDTEAIKAELPTTLSKKIAKVPKNKNVLTDPKGKTVATVNGGKDGTVVTEESGNEAVASVTTAFTTGEGFTLAVKTEKAKYKTVKKVVPHNYDEPNGAKWIDVNLSTQRVTTYRGTTKVKTYVVATGRNTPDRVTDRGTWYIWLKVPIQTMRGEDYVTPNVRWISYFHGGEGFHAAPWVSHFGAPRSHGCVNMVTRQAKEIYDWAPLGTMVKVRGQTPG